jgi:hypothetical protein
MGFSCCSNTSNSARVRFNSAFQTFISRVEYTPLTECFGPQHLPPFAVSSGIAFKGHSWQTSLCNISTPEFARTLIYDVLLFFLCAFAEQASKVLPIRFFFWSIVSFVRSEYFE